jgi:hypothetical protein
MTWWNERLHTNNLVTITEIDTSDTPDVKYFINTVEKKTLSFPLMPKAEERDKRALHFFSLGQYSYSTALRGENSGYHVKFIFIRSSCWHLIGIENAST